MRIRSNNELNTVPPASTVNQAQAGTQSRFDAALLQAAQSVKDSEPDAYSAISPRMQQALASALETLSQKTPSQLQTLARQPQILAALTANLAQTEGLNPAQTTQLNKLLMMALPRLLANRTNSEVAGSSAGASSTGGVQPGPQGGTPAASAFPADFFSILASQSGQAGQTGQAGTFGPNVRSGQSVQSGQSVPAGPAFQGALQGSGFVQDGLGAAAVGSAQASSGGQTAATAGQAPFSGSTASGIFTAEAVPSGGLVLPVSVNAGASAQSLAGLQTSGPQAQDLQQAAGRNQAPLSSGPASNNSGNAQASSQVTNGSGQNASGTQNLNGSTATGFPVLLDMDVQLADSNSPLPIQAESQVTLKGDGTWVLPEGASAPAGAKAGNQPAPQIVAQAPSNQGEQAPQQTALADPLAVLPGAVPPSTLTQASQSSGQPAEGVAATGDAEFAEDLQAAAELAFNTDTAPGASQAQGAQQTGNGAQASGTSQTQASQQLLAQLPTVGQVLQPLGSQNQPGTQADAQMDQTEGIWTGMAQQAGAQAATASATATTQGAAQTVAAFGAALAAVGGSTQAPSGQTDQTAALPGNVAQQISDALNGAGGANPGRLVIQLNPASLGDVQVALSMVDGKLTAHLVTSQQDVRDVLVRDLAGFKASLESHGVIVNEVSVAVRAGVQGQSQGSQQEASQKWGPALSKTTVPEIAALPGGAFAYSASLSGSQQGFNALA
jgi:flagellar hook-length control protein FliK